MTHFPRNRYGLRPELRADVQQFVDAMAARMTLTNRAETVFSERVRQPPVVQYRLQTLPHLSAIARNKEIFPRCEEPLRVLPRCGYKGNTAGERLEDSNGWNARKRGSIG
jgi:hypothetical protein